jgi:hypothetical protein
MSKEANCPQCSSLIKGVDGKRRRDPSRVMAFPIARKSMDSIANCLACHVRPVWCGFASRHLLGLPPIHCPFPACSLVNDDDKSALFTFLRALGVLLFYLFIYLRLVSTMELNPNPPGHNLASWTPCEISLLVFENSRRHRQRVRPRKGMPEEGKNWSMDANGRDAMGNNSSPEWVL